MSLATVAIYRNKSKKKTEKLHYTSIDKSLNKVVLLLQYTHSPKMAYDGTETAWEQINCGRFISQCWTDVITFIW